MTHDPAMLVVAIITLLIVWTTTVVGVVIWLSSKFRNLEVLLYRELNKHRREIDLTLNDHQRRLQILELKGFGYTKAP